MKNEEQKLPNSYKTATASEARPQSSEKTSQGIKHDEGKLRFDLVPVEAHAAFVEVLTHGAKKYADHNWALGLKYSRVYGATLRHLTSFWQGERFDPDSGMHHLAHALCELYFLLSFDLWKRTELDDRYNEDDRQVEQKKKEFRENDSLRAAIAKEKELNEASKFSVQGCAPGSPRTSVGEAIDAGDRIAKDWREDQVAAYHLQALKDRDGTSKRKIEEQVERMGRAIWFLNNCHTPHQYVGFTFSDVLKKENLTLQDLIASERWEYQNGSLVRKGDRKGTCIELRENTTIRKYSVTIPPHVKSIALGVSLEGEVILRENSNIVLDKEVLYVLHDRSIDVEGTINHDLKTNAVSLFCNCLQNTRYPS